jgi:hypothetical protein
MAVNDSFADANTGLADATDWIIDGSSSGTGAVNVTELGGGADAEIYREYDPDDDGTFEIRLQVDAPTGSWHSQDNDLLISTSENARLVVRNVSGGAADYAVAGYEVDN